MDVKGNSISGKEYFKIVSFYDDYLALNGRDGYQAGDTLALVVPSYLRHGVTDEDVFNEARNAKVVKGVEEYIAKLKKDGIPVRIISTAYRPMWDLVGQHLGIPREHIACTELYLDILRRRFESGALYSVVDQMEQAVLSHLPQIEQAIRAVDEGKNITDVLAEKKNAEWLQILDDCFWRDLPALGFHPLEITPVVGGERKIREAQRFANDLGIPLSTVPYSGDSITDARLFARLREEGGLPIAVNGNMYALRDATVAVATTDMRAMRPLLDSWYEGGPSQVTKFVEGTHNSFRSGKEYDGGQEMVGNVQYDLITPDTIDAVARVHSRVRKEVRGSAAAFG